MSFPAFDKSRTLLEQIQSLERVRDEYQRSSTVSLPDDLMVSTLLRVLPKNIQQHLHLQMTSTTDYAAVRAMVLNYEIASSSFSTHRIHAELGVVTSYSTTAGSGPMEIDRISENYKGKSKGKYGKGKDSKGKGKQAPYKGKGKSASKGMKGKGKGGNKGKGKSGGVSNDTCRYCGKVGRWEKDCRKLKRDQGEQVRQVGATAPPGSSPSSSSVSRSATSYSTGSETSTMQTSSQHGSQTGSNVRRVAFTTPFIEELDESEDLTVFHDSCSYFHDVCMISTIKPFNKLFNNLYNCVCFGRNHASILPRFDMSYSDLDAAWTFSFEDECRPTQQGSRDFESDCKMFSLEDGCKSFEQGSRDFERDCKIFSLEDGCKSFEQGSRDFERDCKIFSLEDGCKSFEQGSRDFKRDFKMFSLEGGCKSFEQDSRALERDCKMFSVEDDCTMFEQDCRAFERDGKTFSFEDGCNMFEQECKMSSLADECKQFETCSHVRAVTAEQMEIVLDSGADVSALPLRYGTIGKSCPQPRDGAFVDAQGGRLNVRDVRIGKVQLGSVSFRERFIIADVTTPLFGIRKHCQGRLVFAC